MASERTERRPEPPRLATRAVFFLLLFEACFAAAACLTDSAAPLEEAGLSVPIPTVEYLR